VTIPYTCQVLLLNAYPKWLIPSSGLSGRPYREASPTYTSKWIALSMNYPEFTGDSWKLKASGRVLNVDKPESVSRGFEL
jgi:hypothetical protein